MKYLLLLGIVFSTSAFADEVRLGQNRITQYSTAGGANPVIMDTHYKDLSLGKNYPASGPERAPASRTALSEQGQQGQVNSLLLAN